MDLRQRPVSQIMQSELVTLAAHETLDLTQDLMSLGRVRHLPVVDAQERVVGVVSHRDLLAAAMSKVLDFDPAARRTFLRSIEVSEVMGKNVFSVGPETAVADAARLLVRHKIGCLPVVDPQGKLVGLVTEVDLLSAAYLD